MRRRPKKLGRYSLKYGTLGSYRRVEEESDPDYVVFLPQEFIGRDTDNVHFLVVVTTTT
jgi:hypothetical protein